MHNLLLMSDIRKGGKTSQYYYIQENGTKEKALHWVSGCDEEIKSFDLGYSDYK